MGFLKPDDRYGSGNGKALRGAWTKIAPRMAEEQGEKLAGFSRRLSDPSSFEWFGDWII
jgi:hypothetical protein